jgi:uncharacterized membrane protein (DUF4010 family)
VALAFAGAYALILMLSAWLSAEIGTAALYTLALVSGLTDVDALTLSALNLANSQVIVPIVAATAISIAVASNLVMKGALVFATGGAVVGRVVATAFAGPFIGLCLGVAALHVLY